MTNLLAMIKSKQRASKLYLSWKKILHFLKIYTTSYLKYPKVLAIFRAKFQFLGRSIFFAYKVTNTELKDYRISSYSCRGDYSFLNS